MRSITKFVSTVTIAIVLEALMAIIHASKNATVLDQMLYPTIRLTRRRDLDRRPRCLSALSVAAEAEIRISRSPMPRKG